MLSRRSFLFAAPALALTAAAGAALLSRASRRPAKRVVFVTIDTLRADHVGVFGYPRNTTPFIDSLAQRGTMFSRVYSASSHTAPSHTSMFTGRFPFQHGVLRNHESLAPQIPSIHTILERQGFASVAFPSVKFLDGKVGFPASPVPLQVARGGGRWYLNAAQVVDNALQWFDGLDRQQPFFTWLHFYDVHQWQGRSNIPEEYFDGRLTPHGSELAQFLIEQHHTPPQFFGGEEQMLHAIEGYDARLRFVDDQLLRLQRALEQRGLNEETLWVITSDHGEGLGNHNYEGHGEFLYQEQIHVPLVVHMSDDRYPSQRVDRLARTVDLLPTVLELVEGGPLPRTEGHSLAAAIRGESLDHLAPLVAFAQRRPRDERSFRRNWRPGEVFSVHNDHAKLIDYSIGEDELYDLSSDPFELENRLGRSTAHETLLRAELATILARSGEVQGRDEEPALNQDEVEELRSLGYL